MLEKNYIYFDRGSQAVEDSKDFTMGGTKNIDTECSSPKAWKFQSPSRLYLQFNAKSDTNYDLILGLTTQDQSASNDLIMEIGANDKTLWTYRNLQIVNSPMVLTIDKNEIHSGKNTITIDVRYSSSSPLYLSYAIIEEVYYTDLSEDGAVTSVSEEGIENKDTVVSKGEHERPVHNCEWMKGITDMTPLAGISIPGTHNSAAINRVFTTFWSCQDHSIKDQLLGGIRLLDIRIRVVGTRPEDLRTCHGKGFMGEYEKLYKVFDAVKEFLEEYNTECVVMTLKVDDWANYKQKKADGKRLILELLNRYEAFLYKSARCPLMKEARGKIYLINRIDDTLDFGAPIGVPDNTKGEYLPATTNRQFRVYVQDNYDFNNGPDKARRDKFAVVRYAMYLRHTEFEKNPLTREDVYLCYCNGFRRGFGVYVMGNIINYYGSKLPLDGRPLIAPWMFFDYPFMTYKTDNYRLMNVIDCIIDLNYIGWGGLRYPKTYHCINPDNDIYEL